jgi:hypothetical protein
MLGYKGFNADLGCLGFQYEVGKTYTMDPQGIQLRSKGFHFCQIPIDVLKYYNKPDDKYAIIKAEGRILDGSNTSVTNQITIVELISKDELIRATNGLFVRPNGDQEWYQNGQYHHLDGPAIELANGSKFWCQKGRPHRENGPAVDYIDGTKEWRQNGQLHRLDGPAIEHVDGSKCWYQNGEFHRLDGPAIESVDGNKYWYQNGQLHRLDGPAVEFFNGDKEWYQNDQLHREDGPAIEYIDGKKEWYQNDIKMDNITV